MITAPGIVVDKFFNDSAPFPIPSIINSVIIFLQKRRSPIRPLRFPVFQRRSAAKNGMAVKTPNYNFSHIVKVNATLVNFCISIASFFRKKAILKFLFIFGKLVAIYDDHDFSPFILKVYSCFNSRPQYQDCGRF